ncbi:GH92 family glycosyl hydrolase [Bacteroides muris (ex Fokt et al. 2023)]|uniref:GH92 family glycosyl hydrolase n=1 Tax=Bacteroides muris (ex Fokt et al. 2023) TaxID=2937417 RepID=A0A9X2NR34_9BACE|nr:GH92 family glycosyl hydrolase [Bacteroides muris (ex Fokt et al. 2023)]MCR6503696.1 GH92 family glycosyl hydrolase [Bacteroides muris (ex Fokt et al. 2023)]
MKLVDKYLWGVAFGALLTSCGANAVQKDYADYVNPFIGTGGHGHTFPGAVVPNGMIQPGPDTRIYGWDACSGYYDMDTVINGFSHLHLSGTGCGDYGEILLMPTIGKQQTVLSEEVASSDVSFAATGGSPAQTLPYASRFRHQSEVAAPGYYSVFLETYGVKAELTSTSRVALHRYTFPESSEAGFILDLDYSLQGQYNRALSLEVVNDSTLRGYKNTNSWAWRHDVYFEAVFSKPFTCDILTDSILHPDGKRVLPVKKALLHFATAKDEQVLVKVALSSVDGEGAKKNLAEIPGWNFERVKADARRDWNEYLGKIDVEGGNVDQKTVFYTALYHTGISPSLFTDIDGRYRGLDREIHTAESDKPMYTIFSLWDTFRALHPLLTIIEPEQNTRFINALLKQYQDGGILPMWELAGNYTGTMIGYHAVPVIVDAYMKGDRGFDARLALEACLRSAEYDTLAPIATTDYLKHAALMPISKYYKNTLGYVPCDKENESVAKGLEYAYNDWCISQLAEALGDTATQHRYAEFGRSYRHYFDSGVRFMRGKDLEGKWRTPFNPRSSNHREDDYCEGTAWQWTWFVPQDVEGLVKLMGGREGFIAKLDSLFTADSTLEGDQTSADISGLIGQYAHGNEPSHHILHLYNKVGQPWKTQALVDSVLHSQYFNNPNGLSGNEDCGQMSAWYVLNAMGFYQLCPGNPEYSIGRPLFDAITIRLPQGKEFKIVVQNNSAENKYIESAVLNRTVLSKPYFTHQQLMEGGTLQVVMTNQPTKWGAE